MGWYFVFFLLSGFCSILYEIVWLRLSMAQFGVTSALVSIVLSMFMAGLGLGSWASGHLLRRYETRLAMPALRLYALTELLIGVSAILVPLELVWGRHLLERAGISSSGAYYLASALCVGFTLVPWCACMGATIPLAMLAIRNRFPLESQRSFSYLYIANVLGAVLGATLPLALIELYGFHGTLKVGAALNGLLSLSALVLSLRAVAEREVSSRGGATAAIALKPPGNRRLLTLLFATGLTSMGIEVVWIRQFTPYMGTAVYTFASILGLYLASTFVGSRIYRRRNIKGRDGRLIWIFLGLFVLFPLISADPSFNISKLLRLLLGIVPFSAALGFVTPMLVDGCSGGDPDKAGSAYAVNVLGCILGPLLSGFLLLPLISERWALFIFSLPWLVVGLHPKWSEDRDGAEPRPGRSSKLRYGVAVLAVILLAVSKDYDAHFVHPEVLRDNTATVIAAGDRGGVKQLFVNGVGMTELSTVTKMMAHLPLAFLDHPAQKALVICFGMGTTYRSLISWGIPSTAVELVPSVPRMFWYFHSDGPQLLRTPGSRVVIDDGRRYLERTTELYDVITVDPPPPIQSAGSSMLYSKEFYSTVKQRLQPDGILQQWLPTGDAAVHASVVRALVESFTYVRVFHTADAHSMKDWGFHFLASSRPLPAWTAEALAQKMPPAAVKDLMEWSQQPSLEREFAAVLDNELPSGRMIAEAPHAPALADDQPVNEYYVLRRKLMSKRWQ